MAASSSSQEPAGGVFEGWNFKGSRSVATRWAMVLSAGLGPGLREWSDSYSGEFTQNKGPCTVQSAGPSSR